MPLLYAVNDATQRRIHNGLPEKHRLAQYGYMKINRYENRHIDISTPIPLHP